MLKHCMLWLCAILVLITTGLAAQPQAFGAHASTENAAAKDVEKELRELGADGDLLLVISKKRVQPADTTAQEWEAVRYGNDRNRLDAR